MKPDTIVSLLAECRSIIEPKSVCDEDLLARIDLALEGEHHLVHRHTLALQQVGKAIRRAKARESRLYETIGMLLVQIEALSRNTNLPIEPKAIPRSIAAKAAKMWGERKRYLMSWGSPEEMRAFEQEYVHSSESK